MTVQKYDTAVFGAGPAGLSIANYLRNQDERVLLIDPNRTLDQPAGPPAGMVNPAAGRKANLGWRHKECYEALKENLDWLTEVSGNTRLYFSDGVMRPAVNEELAENFLSAFQEQKWPEGWVNWLDPKETKEMIPEVAPNHGALFLHCGLTVYVRDYLHTYLNTLVELGIDFYSNTINYNPGESMFELKREQRRFAKAEKIVVAAGADTLTFPEWADLRVEPLKGQLVFYEAPDEIPWRYGISALGYILRREKKMLIAGSTYERNFEDRNPTDVGARQVFEKFNRMVPGLASKIRKIDQQAGIRATTTNHLPILGPHYLQERMYVYTGLGSKGLLFSAYMASLLGDHITKDAAIPDEVSSLRRGALIY